MRRLAAALCLPLAGCVSVPAFHLPDLKPRPAQAAPAQAAPVGPLCPGALTAPMLSAPPIPADAGFPSPTTPAERQAVSSYLEWLHAYAVWGRAGWSRASDAAGFCTAR